MIATIDIRVNAAHPNIPLSPLYAFEGSPSNVRILNVPQRVGKWQIDAVSVTIAMPDNSSTTVPAVAVCGYWVATLPSCDETGYCASGLQITASGTDENGVAVSGYCLGVGDVAILSRDASAVSNGTRYYLHYVAEQPTNPNPGDMCYIDGVLKWYDGMAWQVFATGGGPVIDVVPPSTDPADAGKAADAKATGDALAARPTKAQLDAGWWSEWTIEFYIDSEWVGIDDPSVQEEILSASLAYDSNDGWKITLNRVGGDVREYSPSADAHDENATRLGFTILGGDDVIRATRHRVAAPVPTKPEDMGAASVDDVTLLALYPPEPGSPPKGYVLGTQQDKPLQPQGDYATSAQLAGAVRYDLDPATALTPMLPADAFPIAISSDGGTQTEYTATQVRLQAVDTYYWALVVSNDEEMYYWDYATGAPEGAISPSLTVTFGELSSAPSLIFPVQLTDRSVLKVTLNAANTVIALPSLTSGKVSDFGIDMVNAYTPEVDGTSTPTAASFQLYGTLGTDYNLVVPKGETWSDMTALAPNEMAVYYFTLSAFQIDNLPTWEVVKKVVELVPVPTAP